VYEKLVGKGAVPGSLPKFLKHPLARFALRADYAVSKNTMDDEIGPYIVTLSEAKGLLR